METVTIMRESYDELTKKSKKFDKEKDSLVEFLNEENGNLREQLEKKQTRVSIIKNYTPPWIGVEGPIKIKILNNDELKQEIESHLESLKDRSIDNFKIFGYAFRKKKKKSETN